MKKFLSGCTLAVLLLPVAASAATAEELAAQINALLQQVTQLQQQVGGTTQTTTGATTGTVNPSTVQCPLISRNLKKGMSGEDVRRLQQFLALDPSIYPEAQVTGYYGALTEAAVKKFQCKNKLVCEGSPESTGYGVTGPRTAALLALQCPDILNGGANAGGFIKVTPIAGAAPLNVTIEATVNTAKSCAASTYEIIYGDSSSSGYITVPANTCGELRQVFNHTYSANGTYSIVLRSGVHQTAATVTVTGTGGTPSNPTTGGSQGGGSFGVTAGATGDPFTVTGQFALASSCARYDLDWGDGTAHAMQAEGSCSAGNVTKQLNHTYQTAGNYAITLKRGANLDTTDTIGIVIVQ